MKKIKELQKRSHLNEGRDYGIGFSILNKIGDTFETYLPFTACRDYLNDFIFVEREKVEIGATHGYDHKILGCFKNKKYFYIGVNTLNYNNKSLWGHKSKATEILIENYLNLQRFLNHIEEKLNLKSRTTIEVDEDTLIIKTPSYWSRTTPLISIYTLLIRCYFNIPEDLAFTSESLLTHKAFIDSDIPYIKSCIRFYDKINEIKFDNFNYTKHKVNSSDKYSVHNFGIVGFLNNFKND